MADLRCPKCAGPWKKTKSYAHQCGACCSEASRVHAMRERYGITLEDYDAMHAEQNGLCAICGNPETKTFRKTDAVQRLSVDHCHDTGKVRALLCYRCNTGLGYFRDNAQALLAASWYVKFHRST